MSAPNDEDLQWIQATLQGEKDAFQSIILKYHRMIYDLAFRMLGQRQDAEDATQEAFLRAYRKLSTYKLSFKFSTWLYTVSLNVIRNRLRRRWLKKVFSLSRDEEDEASTFEPLDHAPGPEANLEAKQASDLLDEMIQALKPDWKDVFVLHYVKNLPCKEVAELLEISEESVKIKLFRSRRHLQQKFKRRLRDVV